MEEEARRILDGLKIDLDPRQVVGELPVSKQQMVEIAKALSTNARVLIMDEPTSALTAREIDDLFRIIRDLKEKGCGIVYISHRLEELQHIVDRVTITQDGQYITRMDFQDTNLDEIIAYNGGPHPVRPGGHPAAGHRHHRGGGRVPGRGHPQRRPPEKDREAERRPQGRLATNGC